jgi:hypothetical protein
MDKTLARQEDCKGRARAERARKSEREAFGGLVDVVDDRQLARSRIALNERAAAAFPISFGGSEVLRRLNRANDSF